MPYCNASSTVPSVASRWLCAEKRHTTIPSSFLPLVSAAEMPYSLGSCLSVPRPTKVPLTYSMCTLSAPPISRTVRWFSNLCNSKCGAMNCGCNYGRMTFPSHLHIGVVRSSQGPARVTLPGTEIDFHDFVSSEIADAETSLTSS